MKDSLPVLLSKTDRIIRMKLSDGVPLPRLPGKRRKNQSNRMINRNNKCHNTDSNKHHNTAIHPVINNNHRLVIKAAMAINNRKHHNKHRQLDTAIHPVLQVLAMATHRARMPVTDRTPDTAMPRRVLATHLVLRAMAIQAIWIQALRLVLLDKCLSNRHKCLVAKI